MSRLPEPGEAAAAIDALDQRARAVQSDEDPSVVNLGSLEYHRGTGALRGEAVPSTLAVFGDLFDLGELLTQGGARVIDTSLVDIVSGANDPVSALASLYAQGVATGVLMERARWERRS